MSNENYEEVNPIPEENEDENQMEVEQEQKKIRIPKWLKIAGIIAGSFAGAMVLGKLAAPSPDEEEIEDVPFAETDVSE